MISWNYDDKVRILRGQYANKEGRLIKLVAQLEDIYRLRNYFLVDLDEEKIGIIIDEHNLEKI